MTDNPYPWDRPEDADSLRSIQHYIWNEGYNQGIEDALYVYQGSEVGTWYAYISERFEALLKKVSE